MLPVPSPKVESIYPKKVSKKYHFVEAYVKDKRESDETIAALFEKPKRKNSLQNLLSSNYEGNGSGFAFALPKENNFKI